MRLLNTVRHWGTTSHLVSPAITIVISFDLWFRFLHAYHWIHRQAQVLCQIQTSPGRNVSMAGQPISEGTGTTPVQPYGGYNPRLVLDCFFSRPILRPISNTTPDANDSCRCQQKGIVPNQSKGEVELGGLLRPG
jgi:hypothetical protein